MWYWRQKGISKGVWKGAIEGEGGVETVRAVNGAVEEGRGRCDRERGCVRGL